MPRQDGLRLQLTRVLDGTPSEVWRALTEPDLLASWWGPAGFTASTRELDLRVAVRLQIEMRPPGAGAFSLHGECLEVVPPFRLASFRWEPPDLECARQRRRSSEVARGDHVTGTGRRSRTEALPRPAG
jgi:uncharacterized protein YndB with AHSA1/START domain